jgi:DNA-binding MurR/RpiR family transcriptional regulator
MDNSIKSIENLIRSKLDTLSNREKVIANFFIEQSTNIAFLSIHDISEKISVGRASIVRFAQKLGYDGFYELKLDIKNQLQNKIAPLERYQLALKDSALGVTSINQIAENEVNNINFVVNNFDKKTFDQAAKLLANAETIYCSGFNMSSFLAGSLSFLLQRIGLKSFPTNLGGRSLEEQLINVGSKDVLVTFSFPPYSTETIKAAQFAKKQKCKIISFTNSVASPIIQHSNLVLSVKTDSVIFTNSYSAILVVLYALVNEVAIHNKARFRRAIDKKLSVT